MSSKTKLYAGIGLMAVIGLAILAAVVITYNRAAASPDDVASRFYGNWVQAARNAPPTPIEKNLHTKSIYVTESFGITVSNAAERGYDPVLCLGTAPQNFAIEPAHVSNEGDRAAARFTADGAEGRIVMITDDRGWWRIDELDCEVDLSTPPTPPAETATSTSATSEASTTPQNQGGIRLEALGATTSIQ